MLALLSVRAVCSNIVITPVDAVRGAVLFGAGDAFAQAAERHMDGHSVVKGPLVQSDRLVKATVVGNTMRGESQRTRCAPLAIKVAGVVASPKPHVQLPPAQWKAAEMRTCVPPYTGPATGEI